MKAKIIKAGHIRAINASGTKSRTIIEHWNYTGEEVIVLRKRFLVEQNDSSFQDAVILKKFKNLMLVEYRYSILPNTLLAATKFIYNID